MQIGDTELCRIGSSGFHVRHRDTRISDWSSRSCAGGRRSTLVDCQRTLQQYLIRDVACSIDQGEQQIARCVGAVRVRFRGQSVTVTNLCLHDALHQLCFAHGGYTTIRWQCATFNLCMHLSALGDLFFSKLDRARVVCLQCMPIYRCIQP